MKKVFASVLIFVLIFAFVGCGNSSSDDEDLTEKTYALNIGTQFYDPLASPDLNAQGTAIQYLADQVNEKSDGRIAININWGSILGNSGDMFEMMKVGDLDMTAVGGMGSVDPDFTVFMIPGVIDNLQMAKDLYSNPDGKLFQVMKRIYANNNVMLLSSDYGEFRQIQNSKHEVISPSDCEDLLLRIYADDVVSAYWSGIANTTVMSMSEVYTGLQLGTIDGMEFSPTSTVSHGFVDVLKYWTDVNWQWQDSCDLAINAELLNSMSEEDQQIIQECAWEASKYSCDMLDVHYTEALVYFEEHGMQLHYLTDEERAVWKAYSDSMQDTFKSFVNADLYDEVMGISDAYRASNQ